MDGRVSAPGDRPCVWSTVRCAEGTRGSAPTARSLRLPSLRLRPDAGCRRRAGHLRDGAPLLDQRGLSRPVRRRRRRHHGPDLRELRVRVEHLRRRPPRGRAVRHGVLPRPRHGQPGRQDRARRRLRQGPLHAFPRPASRRAGRAGRLERRRGGGTQPRVVPQRPRGEVGPAHSTRGARQHRPGGVPRRAPPPRRSPWGLSHPGADAGPGGPPPGVSLQPSGAVSGLAACRWRRRAGCGR